MRRWRCWWCRCGEGRNDSDVCWARHLGRLDVPTAAAAAACPPSPAPGASPAACTTSAGPAERGIDPRTTPQLCVPCCRCPAPNIAQTLLNDCKDLDPTIRGLAVRSMAGLRVPELMDSVVSACGWCFDGRGTAGSSVHGGADLADSVGSILILIICCAVCCRVQARFL